MGRFSAAALCTIVAATFGALPAFVAAKTKSKSDKAPPQPIAPHLCTADDFKGVWLGSKYCASVNSASSQIQIQAVLNGCNLFPVTSSSPFVQNLNKWTVALMIHANENGTLDFQVVNIFYNSNTKTCISRKSNVNRDLGSYNGFWSADCTFMATVNGDAPSAPYPSNPYMGTLNPIGKNLDVKTVNYKDVNYALLSTPPFENTFGTIDANLVFVTGNVTEIECDSLLYLILSDQRLKHNIVFVGKSPLGIPIYTFNYREGIKLADGRVLDTQSTFVGAMAQDLLTLAPDAVIMSPEDGYYRVDYAKIDVDFNKL